MTLEELLSLADTRRILLADVDSYCEASALPRPEALNAAARAVAQRYSQGLLSFERGDAMANALYSYACMHIAEFGLPAYMESVFHAFDAAEFNPEEVRGPGPEARFTRPKIAAILSQDQRSRAVSP
jgi:hypothetical protein